ncbi:Peroxisomal 3,2-trans-enoyl-CoA isomerase [Trachymyrmex septentrionalis]|uniref:Peroxisomal 3,2-trans-enoyl-CoA isomerase n=1 Tax=Trachymyrmex septentrionalis TaxID=34720 RepID=A0A195FGI9_9HYME|nr:Peroxisomal 3,2-trans-enoyl-CoA isomerase [Trachymyrmex septentrionalis]
MAHVNSSILSTLENGIQKVVLNKPARKNALSPQMYKELKMLLNESAENNKVLIFVLTANGDFFSSGNDISASMESLSVSVNIVKELIDAIIMYPKLLIAVVNGPAIGIATTILGIFDIVYASDKAYFQTPFSSLGLVAEGCSSYTFPRLLGHSKAGDMLYLGYKMNAQEAKQHGLKKVKRSKNLFSLGHVTYPCCKPSTVAISLSSSTPTFCASVCLLAPPISRPYVIYKLFIKQKIFYNAILVQIIAIETYPGIKNAKVLPDPVLAAPTKSLPSKRGGIAFACISVIFVKPISFIAFNVFSHTFSFNTEKLVSFVTSKPTAVPEEHLLCSPGLFQLLSLIHLYLYKKQALIEINVIIFVTENQDKNKNPLALIIDNFIYRVLVKYVTILNRAILWFISSKKVHINMYPKRLSSEIQMNVCKCLTKW